MAITKTPRLDQTRWSSGQDPVKREDFDSDASEIEANAMVFKEGPITSRPAAGVTGRLFTVKDDPTPANNGRQFYDNGIEWKATSYTNNQLAEALSPSDVALTVRAQASPTVNIFAVQNSASQNHLVITPTGYTTNQLTPGTTGGAQLGYDPSHNQTGLFVSVDPAKPVMVLRGATNQAGNILEFRTASNTILAQFNSGGGANFTGPISATNFTASGTVTAPGIVSTGPTSLIDATVVSGAPSHTALTVEAVTSQSTNLVEYYNAAGARSARLIHDGTIATDGRLLVSGGAGNSGTQTYSASTAVATISNSIGPTTPVLNLFANIAGQTARMVQGFDSNQTMRFFFDSAGNMAVTNNVAAGTVAIGQGMNTSPTPYYNSYSPKFEVMTGTSTGAFNEAITIRHSSTSSAALSREVGMKFKLSDESNQTESNKWAGISARSTQANSASPILSFYTGGQEAGIIDANANFNIYGEVQLKNQQPLRYGGGAYTKIRFADANEYGTMGMQTSNTLFIRSDQIALYSGGTYNQVGGNAGGGSIMAKFTSDRTLLSRLTLSSQGDTYDSTSPTLQIGVTTHMQFSTQSINVYGDAANSQTSELNLMNNGGNLRLGSGGTNVSVPSRRLYMGHVDDVGNNLLLFNGSANGTFSDLGGRAPTNNDWWFDSTNNRIGCYDGTNWHWITAS